MTTHRHPSLTQLDSAAALVGGYRALSDLTEIPRTTMRSWKIVPAEACVKIEAATSGRYGRHHLRPDLWPEAPLPAVSVTAPATLNDIVAEIEDSTEENRRVLKGRRA